ncbi:hypothetical protein BJF85_11015 [Saccharomonospora sp. CUA-673]|uniref:STAS domain-containing protein n=1 Tax=Saccharomonospora sp. CUA-673 TaxID=1904969 RepID=UPI000959DDD7|nr:STAS domain-containing protein [Saccharomonospora sp. CUA-673]OLT48972.1 hypothetical protein BJF85_11015 [Saccharomonospora sp. CUA-673]
MGQMLEVRGIRFHERVEVCEAVGELDLGTAPLLEDQLRHYRMRDLALVVVDLSRVDFCAVAGARVLEQASLDASEDGRQLAVVGSAPVRRVAALAGLDTSVAWRPSVADAVHIAAGVVALRERSAREHAARRDVRSAAQAGATEESASPAADAFTRSAPAWGGSPWTDAVGAGPAWAEGGPPGRPRAAGAG